MFEIIKELIEIIKQITAFSVKAAPYFKSLYEKLDLAPCQKIGFKIALYSLLIILTLTVLFFTFNYLFIEFQGITSQLQVIKLNKLIEIIKYINDMILLAFYVFLLLGLMTIAMTLALLLFILGRKFIFK